MRRVFLDTNILLERIRDSPLWQEARDRANLDLRSTRAYIPAICAGELLAIRERNEWGPERRAIQKQLFRDFPIAPIARSRIWHSYALIQCWTQGVSVAAPRQAPPPKQSRPMGMNDLWIAATVHASGGALLTADRGFLQLDGVWIEVLHVAAPAA